MVQGNGLAVANMVLPAGRYLVIPKLDAANFGTVAYIRCGLDVGNSRLQQASTLIGANPGADGVGVVEATLSLVLPIDLAQDAAVSVRCRPDTATGARESSYIEQGVMVAVPASAIVLQ